MSNFKKYLEMADVGPRTIQFNNFQHLVKELMLGNTLGPNAISLELSGMKDGSKTFQKFTVANISELVNQYNQFFDTPMDEEQISFLMDNIIASLAQELRLKGRIEHSVVNADINKMSIQ